MDKYTDIAKSLVAQMTLEEKLSQVKYNASSIERLGIPAYNWWNEALHGVARAGTATVFPQAIGLAATFDENAVKNVAKTVSNEARAKYNAQRKAGDSDIYKGLTMWAPNVNIFRDSRWGRGHETYGEDPFLTSKLGCAYVEGLQQRKEDGSIKVAACAKHFAVHSGPEELRHEFDAIVSKRDMAETYLPAFKSLVKDARVEAVMGAYNAVNGEVCCGSKTLLCDILRNEWGFEGHVVSDCWAVMDFHLHHKVTTNAVESAALAMNNGCDLNCGVAFSYLGEAIKEGLITEEALDRAVIRLMETRLRLGTIKGYESDYDNIPYSINDSKEARGLNLEVAKDSLVLLKNDGVLPLKKESVTTIGVIGPNADSRQALIGNYCGTASKYITVLDGLWDYLDDDVRIIYSEGCHLYKDKVENLALQNDRISEVKAVCNESDVVVVVLGLDSSLEGEEGDTGNAYASGDKNTLDLPGLQNDVLKIACESGKKVIAVIMSGSALNLSYAKEHANAIIEAWYPGAQGGKAIAELIFGEYSPSGRLPITFYNSTEELPDFTDYSMQNRTYRYMKNKPLYPFGYGLSYTAFDVSKAKLISSDIRKTGVKLEVTVTNTGDIEGKYVLQVYVGCDNAIAPNPQLKYFSKIYLDKKETMKTVIILPKTAFELADENGVFSVWNDNYTIYISDSSDVSNAIAIDVE